MRVGESEFVETSLVCDLDLEVRVHGCRGVTTDVLLDFAFPNTMQHVD